MCLVIRKVSIFVRVLLRFSKAEIESGQKLHALNSAQLPILWMKLKYSVKTQAAQAHDARSNLVFVFMRSWRDLFAIYM